MQWVYTAKDFKLLWTRLPFPERTLNSIPSNNCQSREPRIWQKSFERQPTNKLFKICYSLTKFRIWLIFIWLWRETLNEMHISRYSSNMISCTERLPCTCLCHFCRFFPIFHRKAKSDDRIAYLAFSQWFHVIPSNLECGPSIFPFSFPSPNLFPRFVPSICICRPFVHFELLPSARHFVFFCFKSHFFASFPLFSQRFSISFTKWFLFVLFAIASYTTYIYGMNVNERRTITAHSGTAQIRVDFTLIARDSFIFQRDGIARANEISDFWC